MKKRKQVASTEAKPIKFDRNETQTVYLSLPYKGRKAEVSHALNFPTDERILQFFRERIIEEKFSEKGIETTSEVSAASVKLWNELAVGRDGYAQNDRTDWKERTNEAHKESAIDGLLFCNSILPEVLDAEFLGVEDDEQELIKLKILFNGQWVFPEIVFNQPNAEQMRRYRKIRDSNIRHDGETLISTNQFNVAERAALFDELIFSPIEDLAIHHKAAAAMTLFEQQIEFVAKN